VRNPILLPALENFNTGLQQISPASKYCKMVLGDDWIYPECLERMVCVAESHPTIGLVSAYALEGTHVTLTGLPYQRTFVEGREVARRHFLESLYIFGTQTSVMYRSDLIRTRAKFFNEKNPYADTEICFELLRTVDFGFVHQVLTFTRVRTNSTYTRALEFDPGWGATLNLLVTYGPWYLSRAELDARMEKHLAGYYRFLAKKLPVRRDRLFWNFHVSQLQAAGAVRSRASLILKLIEAALLARGHKAR
jgi:hypothetical protein